MQVTFQRNGTEAARSFSIRKEGGSEETLTKASSRTEEVGFKNGDVSLAGTLIAPATGGSDRAVVFLHGSGPLNRYSFGPFPDFFLSRGFAVLVYDKRGTGKSTGKLDSSTLDDLAADGQAAVRFLKEHEHVKQVGLCGASQGGFLAAAVAAGNPDVTFLVDLYGMYVPVWQQELYRSEAEMRADQLSAAEIDEGLAFVKKEFEVAKTGNDWDSLAKTMSQSKEKKWWRYVTKADSLEELRHDWQTLYSYGSGAAFGEGDLSRARGLWRTRYLDAGSTNGREHAARPRNCAQLRFHFQGFPQGGSWPARIRNRSEG
jgi:pimeloyl-ACP methyl ester carboxylesterase